VSEAFDRLGHILGITIIVQTKMVVFKKKKIVLYLFSTYMSNRKKKKKTQISKL